MSVLKRKKEIEIKYASKEPVDFYLYKTTTTPNITSQATIWDVALTVDSIANIIDWQAITIYEGAKMFQSIIISSTWTTINIASWLDFAFTTSAIVEIWDWNMAVDWTTPVEFSIKAPPLANIKVTQTNISMLWSSVMDNWKFWSLIQLSKGINFRTVNWLHKNLATVVNNTWFSEIGFKNQYADKAPAWKYWFESKRDILSSNWTVLKLVWKENSKYLIIVQDDLTGLDNFACTINWHLFSN